MLDLFAGQRILRIQQAGRSGALQTIENHVLVIGQRARRQLAPQLQLGRDRRFDLEQRDRHDHLTRPFEPDLHPGPVQHPDNAHRMTPVLIPIDGIHHGTIDSAITRAAFNR